MSAAQEKADQTKKRLSGTPLVVLPLCIERILLDRTHWNIVECPGDAEGETQLIDLDDIGKTGNPQTPSEDNGWISVTSIVKELKLRYKITASNDKVLKTLKSLDEHYAEFIEKQKINANKCLYPRLRLQIKHVDDKKAGDNCKYWCRISHFFTSAEIEYLVTLARTSGSAEAAGLEDKIMSFAGGSEQERILDKVNNCYGTNSSTVKMAEVLKSVSLLQAAINKGKRVRFSYPEPDGKMKLWKRMLPYCVGMNDGHFYLVVKSKARGAKSDKFRMLRVDRMAEIEHETYSRNEWPEDYEAQQAEAERYLRAAINGYLSKKSEHVTVKCLQKGKAHFIEEAFENHPDFQQLNMGTRVVNSDEPEFRFFASKQGMASWALNHADIAVVTESAELQEEIIGALSKGMCNYLNEAKKNGAETIDKEGLKPLYAMLKGLFEDK